MLGAIIIVPAFGGSASAHHSNIDGDVECTGVVSWTATSWATGPAGTNPDIRVLTQVGNVSTEIARGAFNDANDYTFSGTFTWPANTGNITISSKPVGTWGNGTVSTTGDSKSISKPSNCPAQPGVSKAVSCTNTSPGKGDGTVVLTLTNNASQFASSVTFKVYDPDQTSTNASYTVATGMSTPVTFSGLSDGSHSVKIRSGNSDYNQTFTIECDSPIPAVTHSVTCANGDGQVVVTLSNTGGESATFDVTDPSTGTVEHVTVSGNNTKTRTFNGLSDGDYTVTVKVGAADFSQTFSVDCDHALPKVSTTVACDDSSHDGSVTITLANEGTEAVVFHVTNPNTGVIENVTVAAGANSTRTFGGLSDGAKAVTVTAEGQDYTQRFTVHCDVAPSFSHTETCVSGDGNIAVTLINTDGDDVAAVFVLEGTVYTLAPRDNKVVTLSYADGRHVVSLTVNGADKSFPIIVDCDRPGEPAVEIAQDCADDDGVVVVTLKNIGGQLSLTFTVQGVSYEVAADDELPVTVSGLIDGAQIISITQGNNEFPKPVTIGCDQPPTAGYTQTCVEGANGTSDGQVIVTLSNNSDDVAVTFTVDGDEYTVDANESLPVTIDGLADGAPTIDVRVGELTLGFVDIAIACDHPGVGTASATADCADNDGLVTVTLVATGGEKPVEFTVDGVTYSVDPDTTFDVIYAGLDDGTQRIAVSVGERDLPIEIDTSCDLAPLAGYVQACANFDDSVSILIENPGDDVAVTFTINGTDYTLAAGESQTVVVEGLGDGENTITLAINGEPQDDIVVTSDCDPVVMVTAVCNSVDVDGTMTGFWFTIVNTEGTDVTVTWDGGSANVPAGQSTMVNSASASLVLLHNDAEIARSAATEAICERPVTFTKELHGQPGTAETYTIRVSRLVGESYVEERTFDLHARESKTVNLPSTFDPAGIDYKFEEIVAGTANTSVVSPDSLKLSGHLGETVNVVVTNGYAAVQIDKLSLTSAVVPGGQITYTLQATNTGGLTLDPVVISDRLPIATELVFASVGSGAGSCALSETARPQLLTCTMTDALAPAAVSALITVEVKVDESLGAGTTVVNQAMVHGAYTSTDSGTLTAAVIGAGVTGADLSCVPVIQGTVCNLSSRVGVPIAEPQVGQAGPAPTSPLPAEPVAPTPVVASPVAASFVAPDTIAAAPQLPRTGAGHLAETLVIGFGCMLVGGVLLLGRRRVPAR